MSDFEAKIFDAVRQAVKDVYDVDVDESVAAVATPKDPTLGDYASSAAMRLSKTLHKSPLPRPWRSG